jgi:tetratricopeptide (TPR) repeat protein
MTRSKIFYYCLFFLLLLGSCKPGDKKIEHQFAADPNSIESIKNDIRKNPDSLMLKENLIEAYRNAGYYDSAIAVANQELQKDSGSAYLWNIKASLYFENNDTLNAIKSLQHAIDIYPLPDYLVALGTVYAEIKDKNSLVIADGLLRSNKSKMGKDAYFIKGLYYNYTNDFKKAILNLDS